MVIDRLREFLNKDEIPNKFTLAMGELIRQAREERGLSQVQLAEAIYKRRASISEMENGKMMPDVVSLVMMANRLEKPITYFFPSFYIQRLLPPTELTDEETELLIHFRRISKEQRGLAIQQVKSIADFGQDIP